MSSGFLDWAGTSLRNRSVAPPPTPTRNLTPQPTPTPRKVRTRPPTPTPKPWLGANGQEMTPQPPRASTALPSAAARVARWLEGRLMQPF